MEAKPVRIGGLMRCCTATVQNEQNKPNRPEPKEGEVIDCQHCSSTIRFRNGAWEWNHD